MTDPLLGPTQVRELAARLGVTPTKTLGQNFVVDPGTVRRIVKAAGVRAGERVVEVGPGLGSLTLGLLEAGADVLAVEIDRALAAALPGTVHDRLPDAADRLTVLHADALRVDALPGPPPVALVANLPYNVAVPVIIGFLERFASIDRVLVMVQSEVADRLVAPPGSRTYGIPSVKAAWFAHAEPAGSIGRAVFWPVPRVDSALVRMVRREPPVTSVDRSRVFAVVDAAFAQRRKMLRSALAGLAGSAEAASRALTAAGVPPTERGEQLTVTQFAAVAHALASVGDLPGTVPEWES